MGHYGGKDAGPPNAMCMGHHGGAIVTVAVLRGGEKRCNGGGRRKHREEDKDSINVTSLAYHEKWLRLHFTLTFSPSPLTTHILHC